MDRRDEVPRDELPAVKRRRIDDDDDEFAMFKFEDSYFEDVRDYDDDEDDEDDERIFVRDLKREMWRGFAWIYPNEEVVRVCFCGETVVVEEPREVHGHFSIARRLRVRRKRAIRRCALSPSAPVKRAGKRFAREIRRWCPAIACFCNGTVRYCTELTIPGYVDCVNRRQIRWFRKQYREEEMGMLWSEKRPDRWWGTLPDKCNKDLFCLNKLFGEEEEDDDEF